jgi:hypothetical protein
MLSSDAHLAHVCSGCGSLLSVTATSASLHPGNGIFGNYDDFESYEFLLNVLGGRGSRKLICQTCNSSAKITPINLPYVYRSAQYTVFKWR